MEPRLQRLCVWCGPAMVVVWLIGFWGFAGFVPPPDPNLSGIEVKALFSEHTTLLRVGLLLTGLSSALLGPYIAVITVQMKRIEGALSTLSYVQLSLGARRAGRSGLRR